jgi:hypothetical protein
VAGYGQAVRQALAVWLQDPGVINGDVETYYGRQDAHELMERTVWHAAQHLRQLAALLETAGETPADRLTDADATGLPLPREVW